MNPRSQALPAAGENISGDRKRVLALSLAAVVLVDLGLVMLLLDDKQLISRAAAVILQKGSAPAHTPSPPAHKDAR
ncbi:MAG: hypothetical protein H7X89_03900 [Rhizobiales bacterium]|nr:hypothetical protein [Hyphomicrobiales bacterium]